MRVRTQSFIFSIRKKIMRLKGLRIYESTKNLHGSWIIKRIFHRKEKLQMYDASYAFTTTLN